MMHEAALKKAHLPGSYLPLVARAEDLSAILAGLRALNFQGLNVTAPLKEAVIPHLTGLSETAKAIGAVNTLVPTAAGYRGDNTDAPGFSRAYLANLGQRKALIYGAGGAARAIIYALRAQEIATTVVARNPQAAAKLAQEFGQTAAPLAELGRLEPFPLVINATSASYEKDLDPAPQIALTPEALVIDINYGRPDNYWAALAALKGAAFQDGLPMLAHQAKLSFQFWVGPTIEPDFATFEAALKLYVQNGLKVLR
jgi:shikimate dehydrogenase